MRDMLLPIYFSMIEKLTSKLPSNVILNEFICLKNLYSESHRHYHNWHHIAKMWGEFDDARHLFHDPIAAEFALFYHDCIYTPVNVQSYNELASEQRANYVATTLGIRDMDFLVRVRLNILYAIDDKYECADSILFKDMDYAILGKPHKEYEEYRINISKEFKFTPVEERIEFLKSLIARKKVFRSQYFYDLYEEQAHENINRELKELS